MRVESQHLLVIVPFDESSRGWVYRREF